MLVSGWKQKSFQVAVRQIGMAIDCPADPIELGPVLIFVSGVTSMRLVFGLRNKALVEWICFPPDTKKKPLSKL